jgi:hypothetical protein
MRPAAAREFALADGEVVQRRAVASPKLGITVCHPYPTSGPLRLGLHTRRTIKVLLWIVTLLLAVVSAGIIATLLVLEWPRAASAAVGAAKRKEPAEKSCGRARDAEGTTRCVRRRDA